MSVSGQHACGEQSQGLGTITPSETREAPQEPPREPKEHCKVPAPPQCYGVIHVTVAIEVYEKEC